MPMNIDVYIDPSVAKLLIVLLIAYLFIHQSRIKTWGLRLRSTGALEPSLIFPKVGTPSLLVMSHPTAFISYSYDDDAHRQWVKDLATRLRGDGVDVMLDQWHAVPGDQLPQFMEKAIRENDFVLIVCTPRYKTKSDNREGGAGYEGDIVTAEIFTKRNHRKFITVLAQGTPNTAIPTSLQGKYHIDLSQPTGRETAYQDLLLTLLGNRPVAPPIGTRATVTPRSAGNPPAPGPTPPDAPLKITGIIVDEVTEPTMDGSPGSSLYRIPFGLSRTPSRLWVDLFISEWDHPMQYTSMHRPGIARVAGNKIILDGTTVEEVKAYHRATLLLSVEQANKKETQYLARAAMQQGREQRRRDDFRRGLDDTSRGIEF
jgi:hypothetical protein